MNIIEAIRTKGKVSRPTEKFLKLGRPIDSEDLLKMFLGGYRNHFSNIQKDWDVRMQLSEEDIFADDWVSSEPLAD